MPFDGPEEWCLSRLPVNRGVGVDFVVGVRSHAGEVLSVYLMDADIEKLMEFLSQIGASASRVGWIERSLAC